MNRAYSILTVKAVQEDQRIIRGTATTPEPDRVGDIVEPLGVVTKILCRCYISTTRALP
jgi:hypothetical protein